MVALIRRSHLNKYSWWGNYCSIGVRLTTAMVEGAVVPAGCAAAWRDLDHKSLVRQRCDGTDDDPSDTQGR